MKGVYLGENHQKNGSIMKKYKFLLILILCAGMLVTCGRSKLENPQPPQDDWNDGYCSDCGGELIWDSVGSRNHYVCNKCGKEYSFDKVMDKTKE